MTSFYDIETTLASAPEGRVPSWSRLARASIPGCALAESGAGQKGKAVGDLKRAIELRREYQPAYAALAQIYFENEQYDDAIDWLTRLADVDPDWQAGYAFEARAGAHGRKGDRARADADMAEACRRGNTRACRGP